jgi:hypothetical protein
MATNPVEYDFDICSEDSQYALHNENETTIRFSTTVNQVLCTVCLIFKPFCLHARSLIYHDYEIRCIIPHGASIEAVSQSKHSIAAEAQRLYTKCFLANAGYKLAVSESE